MKFSKKILSILLAVMLAFSVFGICASAAGTASGNEAITVTISTDAENYDGGANVTVRVNITTNYNCTALRLPIMYDKTVFSVPTLIGLTAAGTCASAGNLSSNSNAATCIPDNYDATQFGCVLVQWTANAANGAIGCLNVPDGELAFTFKLKALASAAGRTGNIFIPAETDLLYYQAIQDPTDASTFYYLNSTVMPYTLNGCTASVNGGNVELIPNAACGSEAIIDNQNCLVYGLMTAMASETDVRSQVTATNGGSLEIIDTEYGYGTGTLIYLKSGATTVKTYSVLIYGDLDGDCVINPTDLSKLLLILGGNVDLVQQPLLRLAADLNGDTSVDPLDLTPLLTVIGGFRALDQTDPYI